MSPGPERGKKYRVGDWTPFGRPLTTEEMHNIRKGRKKARKKAERKKRARARRREEREKE